DALPISWPACEDVEFPQQPGPYTDMGWPVDARGLSELLVRMHREYPGPALVVTENGAAFPDVVGPDGTVQDDDRIAYLRAHERAVGDADEAGAPVREYYLWSLLDNFEWGYGYAKRFGIVHVDYTTLQRTPKASAHWYAALIRAHRARRRESGQTGLPGTDRRLLPRGAADLGQHPRHVRLGRGLGDPQRLGQPRVRQ